MNYNKCFLIGRVGRDPETRTLNNGTMVCKFSIATSEKFKHGEEWKTKTTWHNIVAWSKTAEIAAKYITKGSLIHVEGKITTNEWENESGEKRTKTEIVMNNLQLLEKREKRDVQGNISGDVDYSDSDIDDIPF